jgi:eukaryotic-like serine/threonine-protein kinase
MLVEAHPCLDALWHLFKDLKERSVLKRFMQKLRGTSDSLELPGFTPIGVIRQGSMAVIYKATDRATGQVVAIKLHKPEAKKAMDKLESRFRDVTEGEITSSFDHPNVIKCISHGDLGGTQFIVLEYLEGMTLAGLTAGDSQKLTGRRLAYVRQAALGLAHVHGRRFVHHDFCLKNLFVTTSGRLKVIDFGLATPLAGSPGPSSRMGSAEIMAPEVLRREPTDYRVDIFAWGVVAYQVLSGHWPFESSDTHQTLSRVLNVRPVPVEQRVAGLPAEVSILIMKCLDKDPSKRPSGMAGAAAILERHQATAI